MATTLQPITNKNRIESLDVLRGFAIIGVLFALFLQGEQVNVPPEKLTRLDKLINTLAGIFLIGKAYNLLAVLFGYGFALQTMRARQSETDLLPLALRRALGLYILGTLHAILLRDGDVIYIYAILSLFIILLRNSSDKKLIAVIIITLFFPAIYYLLLRWLGLERGPRTGVTEGTGLIAKNISYLVQQWYPYFIEINGGVLFLLLVGMYAARKRWLEKLQANPRQLNILIIAGSLLALGSFTIPWQRLFPAAENYYSRFFINLFRSIVRLPFKWGIDFVYIGVFLHLIRIGKPKILLTSLANMGKMSLTNYLMQDIFWIPVFLIFNLWSKVPPTLQVLLPACYALLQIWYSTWWLKHFRFGPFEWLLRSFTYWKWQPMKKKETIQTVEIVL